VPARTRRPYRTPVRSRRRLAWATFAQSGLSFTTGQSRVFDLLADTNFAINHAGFTVMRTEFICQFNYGNQNDSWSFGTIVTRLGDIGTATPNVVANADLWWLWFDQVFPTASAAAFDQAFDYRATSRTKRKIHEAGDTYAIAVTNNSSATHACSLTVRTLIALP
jgi:hypothetical protein